MLFEQLVKMEQILSGREYSDCLPLIRVLTVQMIPWHACTASFPIISTSALLTEPPPRYLGLHNSLQSHEAFSKLHYLLCQCLWFTDERHVARLEINHIPLNFRLLKPQILHEGRIATIVQCAYIGPSPIERCICPGRRRSFTKEDRVRMRYHGVLELFGTRLVAVVVQDFRGRFNQSETLGRLER